MDKLCIPYVTEYSKVLTKQSTVREVLEYIHEDLAVSDTLLNHYDSYGQAAKGDDYEMDTDLALEAGECLTKKGETVDGISLKEEEA